MYGLVGFIVGLILVLVGGGLMFLFPSTLRHQPTGFAKVGIVLGLLLIFIGGALMFL